MLSPQLKKNLAMSIVVAMVLVGSNLANLKKLSTTTKMSFFPSHFERHVIK
jgi:hypothetical protein